MDHYSSHLRSHKPTGQTELGPIFISSVGQVATDTWLHSLPFQTWGSGKLSSQEHCKILIQRMDSFVPQNTSNTATLQPVPIPEQTYRKMQLAWARGFSHWQAAPQVLISTRIQVIPWATLQSQPTYRLQRWLTSKSQDQRPPGHKPVQGASYRDSWDLR